MPSKNKIPAPPRIELPAVVMKRLARGALAATSNDDVTPVITGAVFRAVDGVVSAVATDRYRIHRATAVWEGAEFPPILVPRGALAWIDKNAGFFGRHAAKATIALEFVAAPVTDPLPTPVTEAIQAPPGLVTITISEEPTEGAQRLSFTSATIRGNFPPVEGLLAPALAAEPAPMDGAMNLDFVAKTRALAVDQWDRPKLRFVTSDRGSNQLLVVYSEGVALVQGFTGGK